MEKRTGHQAETETNKNPQQTKQQKNPPKHGKVRISGWLSQPEEW